MTRETRADRQFRARSIQRLFYGLALALAGLALVLGEIRLGTLVIPQSPWAGTFLALAGVLFMVAAVAGMRRGRTPGERP